MIRHEIEWSTLLSLRVQIYLLSSVAFACFACLTFFILCKPETATLNKRNELPSKCRHKDKFQLRKVK